MRPRAALLGAAAVALAACTSASSDPSSKATAALSTTSSPASTPAGSASVSSGSAAAAGAVCWSTPVAATGTADFTDVTAGLGVEAALTGMMVHAVAAGDVNGDGFTDLFVGSFADRPPSEYAVRGASGPAPDRLLLGSASGFVIDKTFPQMFGRTAGAAFADLDTDGDLDLVLSRNPRPNPRADEPSVVLRNDDGRFTQTTVLDTTRGGRSVGVLDVDADGLLDLVLTEDRWSGGASVLLHNEGGLTFTDQTAAAGLPSDIHALGVSTVDLTGDGTPDLFFAGSNRLFIGTGDGRFAEEEAPEFAWQIYGEEDDVAGVAAGDLDGDGRLDLVLGQHFNSTLDFGKRVPIRVYRNLGPGEGRAARFADVTAAAGIPDLPTKAPHVQIADLDADGRPDIVTTAASGDRPVTLMNTSAPGQALRFAPLAPVVAPTEPTYWVTGAVFDADHDGRLEIFLAEWYPQRPSRTLRQSGGSGHWLVVDPGAGQRVGSIVAAYEKGHAGEPEHLLGRQEVGASTGFGAGAEAIARFGLGAATGADVVVTQPGRGDIVLRDLPADSFVRAAGVC